LLLGFGFTACSSNTTEPDMEEPDLLSGNYRLEGWQIIRTYPRWPVQEGDVPEVDSSGISSHLIVERIEGKQDTIRLIGLEGADVGDYHEYLFPECTRADDCKIYGRMVTDQDFVVDVTNGERRYFGIGTILTIDIYVNGTYRYREKEIEYQLNGNRLQDW
jgi:hypothetical protein